MGVHKSHRSITHDTPSCDFAQQLFLQEVHPHSYHLSHGSYKFPVTKGDICHDNQEHLQKDPILSKRCGKQAIMKHCRKKTWVPAFFRNVYLVFISICHSQYRLKIQSVSGLFFLYKKNSLAFKRALHHSFVRVKRASKNTSHQFDCQR